MPTSHCSLAHLVHHTVLEVEVFEQRVGIVGVDHVLFLRAHVDVFEQHSQLLVLYRGLERLAAARAREEAEVEERNELEDLGRWKILAAARLHRIREKGRGERVRHDEVLHRLAIRFTQFAVHQLQHEGEQRIYFLRRLRNLFRLPRATPHGQPLEHVLRVENAALHHVVQRLELNIDHLKKRRHGGNPC